MERSFLVRLADAMAASLMIALTGWIFVMTTVALICRCCIVDTRLINSITTMTRDSFLAFLISGLGMGLVIGLDRTHNFDFVSRLLNHRRQRRILRQRLEAEWAGVPDGAISRAQPPGEPQPTAASLSRADAPEEKKSMLVSAVEEAETYETAKVSA